MIGQKISHYEILEKLGEGGMGIVYKARDLKLNRLVALKFLPDRVSTTAEEAARFIQEAQAAAALNHPNICTIYGIEESDGTHFIAMEFVEGRTLQTEKSSLPLKRALAIGVQIADALGAAHEQGIVHRDIKPENIMLRKDGSAVVMDFGLAKLRGASRLTKASSTVGTAGYMSPEQILGQDVDHRSDIFALGVVLYELVAGEPPFKGVHETALTYEIVNVDPKPISSFRQDVPAELDAIILECLEKEKEERYQSAKDIAKDLRKFTRSTEGRRSRTIQSATALSSAGSAVEPLSPDAGRVSVVNVLRRPGARRIGLVAALILLPLISALIAWMLHPEPLKAVRKFQWSFDDDMCAISPDGSKLASARGHTLRIRSFDKLVPVEIEANNTIASVFWSPKSDYVAFFTNTSNSKHELRRVSWAGSGNTLIATTEASTYPRFWGTDDSILISSWDGRGLNFLWKVPASGGDLHPVQGGDSSLFTIVGNLTHVAPLPDEKALLLSVSGIGGRGKVFAQNEHGRSLVFEGSAESSLGRVAYDRSGVILLPLSVRASASDLWALPFDPSSLKATGNRFLVARNADDISLSGTGTLLYIQRGAATGKEEWVVLSRTGQQRGILPGSHPEVWSPASSPDGKTFAMSAYGAGGDYDLWLLDTKREAQFQLSFHIPSVYHPSWSPDGSRIVFQSGYWDTTAIYVQSTDGLSQPQLLISASSGGGSEPVWSADGRYIVFTRKNAGQTDNQSDLWYLDLGANASPHRFAETPSSEAQPCLSPNGRYITFVSDRSGRPEIYVTEFPTPVRQKQVSLEGGEFPQWVGNQIFYVAPNVQTLMSVSVEAALQPGIPRKLFSADSIGVGLRSGNALAYWVMRDGKSIIAKRSAQHSSSSHLVMVENWYEEFGHSR
jgi:serine/threonine protein kinase